MVTTKKVAGELARGARRTFRDVAGQDRVLQKKEEADLPKEMQKVVPGLRRKNQRITEKRYLDAYSRDVDRQLKSVDQGAKGTLSAAEAKKIADPELRTRAIDVRARLLLGAGIEVSKVPSSISANGASAGAELRLTFNAMPRLGRGPARHIRGEATVSGTGFNDALPRLKVLSLRVFDKDSDAPVATIKNPKAESPAPERGTRKKVIEFELPVGSRHGSDTRYAAVLEVSINGSKPQHVRSDYMKVMVAH